MNEENHETAVTIADFRVAIWTHHFLRRKEWYPLDSNVVWNSKRESYRNINRL
jgi:hypothetical protein